MQQSAIFHRSSLKVASNSQIAFSVSSNISNPPVSYLLRRICPSHPVPRSSCAIPSHKYDSSLARSRSHQQPPTVPSTPQLRSSSLSAREELQRPVRSRYTSEIQRKHLSYLTLKSARLSKDVLYYRAVAV